MFFARTQEFEPLEGLRNPKSDMASEATSKKKSVVLAKEYGTKASSRPSCSAKERTIIRKVPLSKAR